MSLSDGVRYSVNSGNPVATIRVTTRYCPTSSAVGLSRLGVCRRMPSMFVVSSSDSFARSWLIA